MTPKTAISPARASAYDVLLRVERGGYASDLLREARLDERDAGLASEIVFGVLRLRAQLDYLIEQHCGRPLGRLDPEVLLALRMGVYQRRYLDRVPAHAAVSESVELVKRAGKRSAAGMVNAVLRRVGTGPVSWPDRATALSIPPWMLERWERQYGAETATGMARAFLARPEFYVRLPAGAAHDQLALESTDVPGCYRVLAGRPEARVIQDIGSQSIVPRLELGAGMSFLDLCAAPGNKTAQALEAGVRAVACDVSWKRLEGLRSLGCALVLLDGTRPLPFAGRFERILVDAPCSGTGTMGRNPEIKWRVQRSDLEEFHRRQVRLLTSALGHLEAGGRLVYSTCSLEREENEDVVSESLSRTPSGRRVEHTLQRLPGRDAGEGFYAAVITSD